MQVVFHIGAHATGQDRLIRTLLKNRDVLAGEGVWVPGPGRYRRTLSEAIEILKGARAAPGAVDVLLETILDSDDAERVILSGEDFLCTAARALEYGQLYPRAGKSAWLRNAFPDAQVEFAFTLRNIATFLPALAAETDGTLPPCPDPFALRWSDVIEVIGEANPGARILVWRAEDAAILWPEILREIADLPLTLPLVGLDDLARQVLDEDGRRELERRLCETSPETEMARRYLIGDLLAEHGDDPAPDVWPTGMAHALTEAYDADLDRIRRLPGVTLLEP